MKKIILAASIFVIGAIAFTACVKKNFDNPPDTSAYDPHLPVNMTIKALKAMKPFTGSASDTLLITQDYTIAAIVNADDRSGNIYKSLYIQDSSGAIQININSYSLYNDYPVGRKIYIKLKGLYLSYSSNTGTPCLSLAIDEQAGPVGLYGAAINDHIIKANVGNIVKDTVITFGQLKATAGASTDALLCRLVTISDSVQFADTLHTYTDPTATTNRYITQCGTNLYVGNSAPAGTVAVRTSNYATFHAVKLPFGKGIIRGIYTRYNTSPQLLIRDTTDVMFGGPRCGGTSSGGGGSTAPIITIDSLRKLYPGSGTYNITTPARITGVVISDIDNKNTASGNFVIEDGSKKGITMYISGSTAYKIGDSVVVDVSTANIKKYPTTGVGALEIDGLTASKVTTVATGKSVTPITITIAALNANINNYENVLVKIVGATASGGTTYGSSVTLSDATSANGISLYTGTTATFAGQTVPTGPKTYIGIALPYSTKNEIKLRNPATDVQ